MTSRVDEVLDPFIRRVQAPPGRNGLSRSMNKDLRAHPEIAEIIRRTMIRLIEWETLVDLSGMVKFTRMDLYRLLCEIEEDWVLEVPDVKYVGDPYAPMAHFLKTGEMEIPDEWGPTVVFKRKPRFEFRVFDSAMTIAKRVGLVWGHGQLLAHPQLLKKLRILRKQRIPEPNVTVDEVSGSKEATL